MATMNAANVVIDNAILNEGMIFGMSEELNIFNEQSGGSILFIENANVFGDYLTNVQWTLGAGAERRIVTGAGSYADWDIPGMEQMSGNGISVARKWGRKFNISAYRDAGMTDEEFSFVIGKLLGYHKIADRRLLAAQILPAAISAVAGAVLDISGETPGTMSYSALGRGFRVFGSRAGELRTILTHSKVDGDLFENALDMAITNVTDAAIYGGSRATLGRPMLVTDYTELVDATPTPDEYKTLLMARGAMVIQEGERSNIYHMETKTEKENLYGVFQAEWRDYIQVRGRSWDLANGGLNPNTAALTTATNWDVLTGATVQDGPGVLMISQ